LAYPPCNAGTVWAIWVAHSTVSEAQVQAFPYSNNFRPVMPLDGRVITLN